MSRLRDLLFNALLFIIVASAALAFLGNLVAGIQNWGTEEHTIYARSKNECVSSPPFSSDFGPIVLRYDSVDKKPILHIDLDLNASFEKKDNLAISSVQIDDGEVFDIENELTPYWSVNLIAPQERFFSEFGNGKTLLIFLKDRKLATVRISKIQGGAKRFIGNLKKCYNDHVNGSSHGPHYK